MPDLVALIETCLMCGLEFTVEYWSDDYEEWLKGKRSLVAMPYLNADQRSLVVCQLCSKCFSLAMALEPKNDGEQCMTYDPKCEELARHFWPIRTLSNPKVNEERIRELASVIQEAIEDWLRAHPC